MSGSINKVILIGRLGKDPEIRQTQGGDKVANFSLATDEGYKDKQGNKVEKTEWHKVIIWGKLAEVVEKYLRKGAHVYIEGKIQTRKWTDKDNVERYSTEVLANSMQMLGSKDTASKDEGRDFGQKQADRASDTPFDDDIPF